MKKVLLTLVTVVLVLASVMSFTACKKEQAVKENLDGYGENAPVASVVGDKIVPITADMTGEQMMIIANNNYEKCDYASVLQQGDVNTTVLGLKVVQSVEGLRIREDGNTFMYNNSYTSGGSLPVDVKVMEKYYVDKSGSIKLISAGDAKNVIIDDTTHKLTATAWPVKGDYATKEEYLANNPNDPSRVSMYVLNEDTITETTAPVVKENANGDKYYEFDVTCDAYKAFVEYVPVMKYMLAQSVGDAADINMKKGMALTFKVQIWENGLFKKYDVTEQYKMKIMSFINGNIALVSQVKFSYEKSEKAFADYYKDNAFVL